MSAGRVLHNVSSGTVYICPVGLRFVASGSVFCMPGGIRVVTSGSVKPGGIRVVPGGSVCTSRTTRAGFSSCTDPLFTFTMFEPKLYIAYSGNTINDEPINTQIEMIIIDNVGSPAVLGVGVVTGDGVETGTSPKTTVGVDTPNADIPEFAREPERFSKLTAAVTNACCSATIRTVVATRMRSLSTTRR